MFKGIFEFMIGYYVKSQSSKNLFTFLPLFLIVQGPPARCYAPRLRVIHLLPQIGFLFVFFVVVVSFFLVVRAGLISILAGCSIELLVGVGSLPLLSVIVALIP